MNNRHSLTNHPLHSYQVEELGKVVRQRRKLLRVTQSTLADLSGVGAHFISDIESGKGNPTIKVTNKLLAPLGMKLVIQIGKTNSSR